MDTAFYTMVPLAASGLAWVAYRHPVEYGKLSQPLILLGFVIVLCLGAYSAGWFAAVDQVEKIAPEIQLIMPNTWPLFYWTMGTIAYLQFLQLLPMIGIKHGAD